MAVANGISRGQPLPPSLIALYSDTLDGVGAIGAYHCHTIPFHNNHYRIIAKSYLFTSWRHSQNILPTFYMISILEDVVIPADWNVFHPVMTFCDSKKCYRMVPVAAIFCENGVKICQTFHGRGDGENVSSLWHCPKSLQSLYTEFIIIAYVSLKPIKFFQISIKFH